MSTRRPISALGFSLIWPGAGHLYQGLYLRGLLWFVVTAPAIVVAVSGAFGPVGSLIGTAVFAACAADAYRSCKPRSTQAITLAAVRD